jgi:thiol-disulfide isomerase/thioredoxin
MRRDAHRNPISLVILPVLAAIMLAACSQNRPAAAPQKPEGETGETQSINDYQLGFEPGSTDLKASNPSQVSLAAGKPQLIEFFAYWCSACQQMAPVVHGLENKYGSVVNFVYLNIDDSNTQPLQEALAFNARWRPYIVLLDGSGQVAGGPLIGYYNGTMLEQAIIDFLKQEGIPSP